MPEVATDREHELAEKLLDAAARFMIGYTEEEIINALFVVLCGRIGHDSDPADRARQMIDTIEANFLTH